MYFFETSNGGDDRSIPSDGDAVNHRIEETSAAMSKNALSPIFIANITFITLQPKRT